MLFKHTDIHWVKSVKRDGGRGWAFFEEGTELNFLLTFSDRQKKSARRILAGELILLFQRVDQLPGVRPKTYLTHLVTPINNVLKENRNAPHRFKWEREVLVIARAHPPHLISTMPAILNFQKVGFGRADSIETLSETKTKEKIQQHIWDLFGKYFTKNIEKHLNEFIIKTDLDDVDASVLEGKESKLLKWHLYRERRPWIIGLTKSRARDSGNLSCECCGFDFMEHYGDLGSDFIECHHKLPISIGGERRTRPEDLALVCANCHRMLHRKDTAGKYYSVQELKALINYFKKNIK